jgi:hypothetical protein
LNQQTLNTLFGEASPRDPLRLPFIRSSRTTDDMLGDRVEIMNDEPGLARTREFAVVKRSVVIGGHKTSVSLEDAFWTSLKDIAGRRGVTLSRQIASIDQHRQTSNLS